MFTVTTALGLGLLGAPAALAATAVPGPAPTVNAGEQSAQTGIAKAVYAAKAKAKATGKPVTIDELTTESTETSANPDGSLTSTSHAQAVRAKRGSGWADLDATLHANADGTVTPAVTGAGLSLSGGGTGPLATVTTADGKKLSVGAPFALPKPTLDGATATYASVLPDVDLRVTALPNGGWRDVIVVNTAAAAANPKLAKLHFPIETTGLGVATDKAGNVTLKDSAGTVRMHAPTAFQWDSALPAPAAPGYHPQAKLRSAFAAPNAVDTPPVGSSTAAEPGDAATVGTMTTTATATGMDLTPDQTKLGKGTGPWYLDPTVSVDGTTQVTAQVQENHPDTANVNTLSSLGIGYCGYSDCTGYGRYRSYFQLAIPSVLTTRNSSHPNPTVYNAFLNANVNSAASTGTNTPIGLYWTGPIGSGTTWNNQPCGTGSTMQGCSQVGNTYWITNTGGISYDVSAQMAQAVNGQWGNWTVALEATDEYEKLYRHHVDSNPKITVNYDIAPTIWYPRTSPSPGFASDGSTNDCPGQSNPGWLASNQTIKMTSAIWSPIGANVATWYHLWDTDSSGTYNTNPNTGYISTYGDEPMQVDATGFQDGHTYQWESQAGDSWLASAVTGRCYFRVDKTPPTVSVSSTQFPPIGTLGVTSTSKVNDTGTFTIGGSDPVPAGGSASGLACFRWSDNPTPVTGWKCNAGGDGVHGAVIPAGTPSFTYKPTLWGTNVLYVQSQDNAGNYSQPLAYSFYAPWNPAVQPVPGNLNGDGRPDLLFPDSSGNLRMITIGKDPVNAQAAPLGLLTTEPGPALTWNDVQTTHRGALRSMGVDDVFARPTKTSTQKGHLYVYQNNGSGVLTTPTAPLDRATTWADPVTGAQIPAPADYYKADWSQATQLLAFGAMRAPLNKGNESDSTVTDTSLLTVENGHLWLHRAYADSNLDADAVEVSSLAGWDGYDLAAPGSASGYAQPTLWARNQSTGAITSYAVKTKTGSGQTPTMLDLSGLADPTKGTTLTGVAPGSTTAAPFVVKPSDYPTVGSTGDINGDGLPDLWAINANGHLVYWAGIASTTTAGAVVSFNSTPVDLGDPRGAVARIPLAANAADSAGKYAGTVNGNVSFAANGTVAGATPSVANFNAGAATGGWIGNNLQIDTRKSFTVSFWTRPADLSNDGVVLGQDGTTTSNFMIWPSHAGNGVNWRFAMATADGPNWPYDATDNRNAQDQVEVNTWVKLTASYDATSGQMALFVNDVLAATGMHKTTVAPSPGKNLVVGRWLNNGGQSNWYHGSVSSIVVNDFPTSPWQAGVTTPIVSGVNGAKCIDDQSGLTANVNPIEVYDCNASPAQQWSMDPRNNSLHVMGGCLDDTNGATASGSLVNYYSCNGTPAQQWLRQADGSIYLPFADKCLDDPNANVTNLTRLQLYTCNGSPAQQWTVTPRTN
ncbi:ricin-type beta-trefoil lectin domain protein [Kitasatospora sp. MMS16-BH015]|uniref:ricin-type beta-trefoil lectin domain protein n=1 Tax=Kitasatospora sp. MMS16-BH015 TaxID=2018025 RepID=UPI000CF2EB3A|nr:ricin-type beta-trefoil lectin domain protein [Kitasatospora sp. MMS16-BH015]